MKTPSQKTAPSTQERAAKNYQRIVATSKKGISEKYITQKYSGVYI